MAISNSYFKAVFNLHGVIRNVEEEIIYIQNILYNYFKVQHGTVKNDYLTEYHEKYSNLSNCQLKKNSASLKQESNDCNTSEIRYISKLIRSK